MYTALERLEAKRAITSRMGDPTPQRGGRAKRYVKVTPKRMEALKRALQAYERLLDGLNLARGVHA
jgi:DNA-binding PadR family transcriptional regulator